MTWVNLSSLYATKNEVEGKIADLKTNIIGTVNMYAGATAPRGWLLCDGRAVKRTDYAALFAVIGETYGAGDGSTTFNLPDFNGRMPIGTAADGISTNDERTGTGKNKHPWGSSAADTSGWFGRGERGGLGKVTLTSSEMPSHTHGTGSSTWSTFLITNSGNDVVRKSVKPGSGTAVSNLVQSPNSINNNVSKIGKAGGDSAHANLPPYLAVNFIIYAGQ